MSMPSVWSVLLQKKKKISSSPFIAPLMSVGSRDQVKWVTPDFKWVIKWVIFCSQWQGERQPKNIPRRAKIVGRLPQGRKPLLERV